MAVSVYEQVKRALQDIVAPEMKALQVEIKRLDEKIDNLRKEIESVRKELMAEIRRLDERIDGLTREIEVAIDIRERLATIEGRLGIGVKSK